MGWVDRGVAAWAHETRSREACFRGGYPLHPCARLLFLSVYSPQCFSARAAHGRQWRSPHGDRIDEYYWMRDDDAEKKRPEIMRHLEAEKAYCDSMTAPLAPLREKLVAELRSRIKEDDSTVPAGCRAAPRRCHAARLAIGSGG